MKLIKSVLIAAMSITMASAMVSCGSSSNAAAGAAPAKEEKAAKKVTSGAIPEGKEGYAWNFQNVKGLEKSTVKEFILIPSEPAGLTLSIAAGGYFNRMDKLKAAGSGMKKLGASNGMIQPAGTEAKGVTPGTVTTVAKGPFTARMFVSSTGEADKTGRHAFIKIGDKEYINENFTDKVPGTGTSTPGFWLDAKYEGTDEVVVQFAGTDLITIWDAAIVKEDAPAAEAAATEAPAAEAPKN